MAENIRKTVSEFIGAPDTPGATPSAPSVPGPPPMPSALTALADPPVNQPIATYSTPVLPAQFDRVINLMNVLPQQQIELDLMILEVSRVAERNLGIDWSVSYSSPSTTSTLHTILIPDTFNTDPLNFIGISGNIQRGNYSFTALIQLLESDNLVSVLAEPHLTAVSGEKASLFVGGEFPYFGPSSVSVAQPILYKSYGLTLRFLATALPDKTINIQMASVISAFTTDGAADYNGYEIPALKTRVAQTEFISGDGQHIAIGGILDQEANKLFEQFPGIGNAPVLGALFRSQSFQRNETELVIIATPHFVQPAMHDNLASAGPGLQNEGPANLRSAIDDAHGARENTGFVL